MGKISIPFMAIPIAAAEAAELTEASYAASLRGAFAFGQSSLSDYAGLIGSGVAGAAGLAGTLFGAMSTRRRQRRQGGRPAKRRKTVPKRKPLNMRIGGFLGMELKFIDSGRTNLALTSSWQRIDPSTPAGLNSLTPIAEGTGESDRDGRKCLIKAMYIHGQVSWDEITTMDQPGAVRLALVLDTQTNGAALTAADVYTNQAGQQINSFRDLQNTSRFKVLKEIWITPPGVAGNSEGNGTNMTGGGAYLPFVMHCPLNLKQHWSGTTGAVSNIVDHSLHLLALYGGTRTCQIQYSARARFLG